MGSESDVATYLKTHFMIGKNFRTQEWMSVRAYTEQFQIGSVYIVIEMHFLTEY